jgi:predicted benzoate:H+ symporter BenE
VARLALFALLLQLGLSFGHVHPLRADAAALAAPVAAMADPGSADPDPDESYCASCAILTLLSGGHVASAPTLAMPVSLAATLAPIAMDRFRLVARHDSFRSRAPPTS